MVALDVQQAPMDVQLRQRSGLMRQTCRMRGVVIQMGSHGSGHVLKYLQARRRAHASEAVAAGQRVSSTLGELAHGKERKGKFNDKLSGLH